ncbi:hypothetical protein [Streptomyces sp. NPDC056661]|uniref:hypothetical protein n=1 Tax=Streptomyces sp. NPDC056661 TaxID=3345898 RepID=UPI00368060B6
MQMPTPAFQDGSEAGLFADAYQSWVAQFRVPATPDPFALFLRDHFAITTPAGDALSEKQLSPILAGLQQRYEPVITPAESERVSDDVNWEGLCHQV